MRIFRNCAEAASEVKREVAEMGKEVKLKTYQDKNIENDPKFFTRELLCYSFMISEPKDKDKLLEVFGKNTPENKAWCEKEFEERINQTQQNPGESYKFRNNVWDQFMNEGKFAYTYGERIGDQVETVVEMLKENQNSRNAIISIWDRQIDKDRIGGKMRVPCSMFYQVLVRNGKVHLVYNIRSNDVMTHWCFDIWMAISLQEYIAGKLGLPVGDFYQFIGSFHAYQKDLEGIF